MEDGCCSGLLRIRHGRVDALLPAEQIPDGPVIDARDARVIPGIIDTHNHGTCGWSLEHPRGFAQDVETVCRYVKACASQGITGVFPTAVPAMISACAQAAALHPVGAEICGIHSEGPWLARSGEGGSMPPLRSRRYEYGILSVGGRARTAAAGQSRPGDSRRVAGSRLFSLTRCNSRRGAQQQSLRCRHGCL